MTASRPLLITADETLLEDLLRLAAAAGVTLDVAHDPGSALRAWRTAAIVLVGSDRATLLAERRPPRRPQVHVVSRGPADGSLLRSALAVGAHDVVELPAGEAWLAEALTDVTDGVAPAPAVTIGVVGGSGGAGASTLACAVALTAAASGPALLMDLDPLGPGLDRVTGIDAAEGVRWDALLSASGRLGSRSLRAALPSRGALVVLTWSGGAGPSLEPDAVREVLSAAQRGNDVVVVDVPRSGGPVVEETVARCHDLVVVAVATVPGVASASRLLPRLRLSNDRLSLVVRTGAADSLPAHEVAAALELPLLAELPGQRRVVEHIELGLGPVRSRRAPLARAARAVLAGLQRTGGVA